MTALLMRLERWIVAHPAIAKRAEGLLFRLAARRLNGVIDGLLRSIYSQTLAGTWPVSTDGGATLNRDATIAHAHASLTAISLFVQNEARQRGIDLTKP